MASQRVNYIFLGHLSCILPMIKISQFQFKFLSIRKLKPVMIKVQPYSYDALENTFLLVINGIYNIHEVIKINVYWLCIRIKKID